MNTSKQVGKTAMERLDAFEQLWFTEGSVLVRQSWPDAAAFCANAALKESGAKALVEEIAVRCRRLRAAERLQQCPIIGVAGMLNSGKSSTVASFLSPHGRERVPRGLGNSEGTQRFVFWLPNEWRGETETWNLIEEQLRGVFGGRLELLSDDPTQARRQYNEVGSDFELFGVPLLATDPALDALGFGLLDCPDVNRRYGQFDGTATAHKRLEFVGLAAVLCSAFWVVATQANYSDEKFDRLLQELRRRMTGVPLFALLNQIVTGYTLASVRDDFMAVLSQHAVEHCYGAFYFGMQGARGKTPAALLSENPEGEQFPAFFEILADDEQNQPSAVGEQRFLRALPSTLSKGQLFERQIPALWGRLVEIAKQSLVELRNKAAQDHTEFRKTHQALLDVSVELLCDQATGDLRITTTRELLAAINESFARTAPAYCRWMLFLGSGVKKAIQGAGRGLDWLLDQIPLVGFFWRSGRGTVRELNSKLEKAMDQGEEAAQLTAQTLSEKLRTHGLGVNSDPASLEKACAAVIERFSASLSTLEINPAELDAVMAEIWKKVGFGKRAILFVYSMGMLLIGLLLITLIPFTGGGWGIAVFTLQGLASAKVLGSLQVVGQVGIAAFLGGTLLPAITPLIEKQVALPLLANFFAITCDIFGIPRRFGAGEIKFLAGGKTRVLPVARATPQPAVCPLLDAREWEIVEGLGSQIETLIRPDEK